MNVSVTAVLPDQSQNISMSFSLYMNTFSPLNYTLYSLSPDDLSETLTL